MIDTSRLMGVLRHLKNLKRFTALRESLAVHEAKTLKKKATMINVKVLTSAIASWPNLVDLKLSRCTLRFSKDFFDAVRKCPNLEVLMLVAMGINDEMMEDICNTVSSLLRLKDLNLTSNCLTATGLQQLATCLQQRTPKLEMLEVGRNPGSKEECILADLEENCCSVTPPSSLQR